MGAVGLLCACYLYQIISPILHSTNSAKMKLILPILFALCLVVPMGLGDCDKRAGCCYCHFLTGKVATKYPPKCAPGYHCECVRREPQNWYHGTCMFGVLLSLTPVQDQAIASN